MESVKPGNQVQSQEIEWDAWVEMESMYASTLVTNKFWRRKQELTLVLCVTQ